MSRYIGNYLRVPSSEPQQASASGIWSLSEQLAYQRNNQWPPARDPYYNQTVLHLTGNVPNVSGPQAMNVPLAYNSDASTNNFLVTPNGDVSPRPFSPYFGGNYSNYFGGSSDLLRTSVSSLSSSSFTVEAWIYYAGTSTTNATIYDFANATNGYGMYILHTSPGNLTAQFYSNNSGTLIGQIATSFAGNYNKWVHVAVSYDGSIYKLFVDGFLVGAPISSATQVVAINTLTVGARSDTSPTQAWLGYISNFRYVTGAALYTNNFTPSISPLGIAGSGTTRLLTCQSNRFIDNSSSPLTLTVTGTPRVTDNSPFVSSDFTSGAGYFDGTTDYLSVANASALQLSNSTAWCVEFWFYATALASEKALYNGFNPSGSPNYNGFGINLGSNGQPASTLMMYDGTNWTNIATVTTGQWYHIAVSYEGSGTTRRCFLNGQLQGSAGTVPATITNTATATAIGALSNGNFSFPGYISDARVVKGSAIYTSNFPVPTAPLLPVTNTSLLTLQTRAPATNNGFIDSSPNNFVVTRNGNTTQGSFSPFSPTGWGVYGSGTTSYAQLNNADYALGTGDFTIEFWMYLTSDKATTCFCSPPSNPNLTVAMTGGSAGARLFYMEYGGAGTTLGAGSNYLNKWTHVAFVRSSGVVTCYQDGSPTNPGGTSKSASIGSTASLYLLRNSGDTSQDVPGYVSNFRICKSAVYTANFNPPTSALTTTSQGATNCVLLTFQSNRFRDNSNNNSTVTPSANLSVQAFSPFAPAQSYIPSQIGGSGYFDGTGSGTAADYLTVPDSPVFTLGSGDFTLETWIYSTVGSGAERYYIAHTDNATAAASQFALYQRSADAFILFEYYVSTTANSITSGAAITLNQWNHIAVCRSNGTLSMFVNGVRPATGMTNISTTAFNDSASSLGIGGRTSGAALLTGNISGMRLVRGTDVYGASNTTITVPTAPPTAIPNTSLLLNFTNGGIVDATGRNNLETVGNSAVQTKTIQYGTGSMYFDGSDYLIDNLYTNQNYALGSGNWTIEGWFYNQNVSGSSGDVYLISVWGITGQADTTYSQFIFRAVNNNLQIVLQPTGGAGLTSITGTGNGLTANTWQHLAAVRNGNNVSLYINGTSVASTPYTATLNNPASRLVLGAQLSGGAGTYYYTGYMDDIRITKGIARYTINFNTNLPPGPFPLA